MDENLCPECGGPMISRMNGKTGQRFWGCKKFPDCRGTRNTDGEATQEREDRLPSDSATEIHGGGDDRSRPLARAARAARLDAVDRRWGGGASVVDGTARLR